MYSYFIKICYYIERNHGRGYEHLNGGRKMAHKKGKTYLIRIMSILLGIPLILSIVLVSITTIRNNRACDSFAEQLYNYTLPENTTIEERYQLCGQLVGSSKDMDFLAAILVKTELSEAAIKSYYFKASFKGAKKMTHRPVIEIFKPKQAMLDSHYLVHEAIYFSTLENATSMEDYIVIVISDGGYSSWFDLRAY